MNVVNGLIIGLHDPVTIHLAMLYAIGGQQMILASYKAAVDNGYHWHEFGDSHLILPDTQVTNDKPTWLAAHNSPVITRHASLVV